MAEPKKYLDQAGLERVWSKIKEQDSAITQVFGYYLNNKFYTDSTYTVEIPATNKKIYINKSSKEIYYYDGTKYNRCVQEANGDIPGIMKLYNSSGQNIDGTMTQKSITDGISNIKFAIDDKEEECLILELPWN